MRYSFGLITLLLISFASTLVHADTALYGSQGVSPQAVRQGALGTCYFYASIAALAATQPDSLRQAILSDDSGSLRVRFADGKIEQVHPEDIEFARNSDFDHSDGLWVAVLFRGYAQRTLRESILHSLNASTLPLQVKMLTSGAIANSDLLLLAYDRAIRSQIDQGGHINRDGLKAQLSKEMAAVPMLGMWKDSVIETMDSAGFFESLAAQIEANGELFGAYRAAGHGGISEGVLSAFAGSAHTYDIKSRDKAASAISLALQKHQGVVAWTADSPLDELTAKAHSPLDENAKDWFLRAHAYTILGVNTAAGTVTIRNPWGSHPDPAGEFTLSLDEFMSAYTGYSASAIGRNHSGE
jgi:hypothetical protein